jgi:TRAP-type C4-dicarboxylate transport system substrate-binding protein
MRERRHRGSVVVLHSRHRRERATIYNENIVADDQRRDQEWAKEFAAGSRRGVGDKIKVEFYPASQLGQIPATVEGVAMGTIEAVCTCERVFDRA